MPCAVRLRCVDTPKHSCILRGKEAVRKNTCGVPNPIDSGFDFESQAFKQVCNITTFGRIALCHSQDAAFGRLRPCNVTRSINGPSARSEHNGVCATTGDPAASDEPQSAKATSYNMQRNAASNLHSSIKKVWSGRPCTVCLEDLLDNS
mmetsp:Transcript_13574/g.44335  ORF Transcript_13574/g.44335 Transcript_13574/m.44335 type:complete len:149 (+) Transcript_13574:6359-6805(+)